jgi:hypothetical protein
MVILNGSVRKGVGTWVSGTGASVGLAATLPIRAVAGGRREFVTVRGPDTEIAPAEIDIAALRRFSGRFPSCFRGRFPSCFPGCFSTRTSARSGAAA